MTYSFFPNDFHSHPNLQQNATMNYLTQHYKNLSEQLQEKVNHLTRLIEAEDLGVKDVDGDSDRDTQDVLLHNQIVDDIATHHGSMYPHVRVHVSGGPFDREKSIADIKKTLGARRPVFKSLDAALAHMNDTGDFAPDTLTAPNGYMHPKDDRYTEMLKGVDNSIFDEKNKK